MIISLGLVDYNIWFSNPTILINEKSLLPEVETFDIGSLLFITKKT